MKRFLALVLAMALGTAAGSMLPASAPASAEAPMPPGECPEKFDAAGPPLVCHCSVEAISEGSIWGNEIYTSDSSLCRAALHSGAVSDRGGTIRAEARAGRDSYKGKERNGVSSGDWGPWRRSFSVTRAGWSNSVPPDYPATPECPASGSPLATAGVTLTCRCNADAASAGSVWGTGSYTTDSSVCRAALHAGRIGLRGGIVSVHAAGGRESYRGTEANGVGSSEWGSYPTSFEFSE